MLGCAAKSRLNYEDGRLKRSGVLLIPEHRETPFKSLTSMGSLEPFNRRAVGSRCGPADLFPPADRDQTGGLTRSYSRSDAVRSHSAVRNTYRHVVTPTNRL